MTKEEMIFMTRCTTIVEKWMRDKGLDPNAKVAVINQIISKTQKQQPMKDLNRCIGFNPHDHKIIMDKAMNAANNLNNPIELINNTFNMACELYNQILELKNQKQEPMKDLTKILKDGDEVYYTVTGQKHQIGIKKGFHNVILLDGENFLLSCFGSRFDDGECLIFPSKEERNWDNFKRTEEIKRGDLCIFWDGDDKNFNQKGFFIKEHEGLHPFEAASLTCLKIRSRYKYCEKINIEDYI